MVVGSVLTIGMVLLVFSSSFVCLMDWTSVAKNRHTMASNKTPTTKTRPPSTKMDPPTRSQDEDDDDDDDDDDKGLEHAEAFGLSLLSHVAVVVVAGAVVLEDDTHDEEAEDDLGEANTGTSETARF
jgi:hypothetical protein